MPKISQKPRDARAIAAFRGLGGVNSPKSTIPTNDKPHVPDWNIHSIEHVQAFRTRHWVAIPLR